MLKRSRCVLLLLLLLSVAVNAFCVNNAASSEFRDPTPQERAMTSVDFAPGASAVFLNWHQVVNDRDAYRSEYARIKILSEEGKKYGDVEVIHIGLYSEVNHIKARTLRPDGTVAPFDGKTFDKVVVKIGGVRLIAKTFTLPDVQVGSIIEYRYDVANRADMISDNTEFTVQRELPIVHEEFSLQPRIVSGYRTFFSLRGLPPGKKPEIHGDTFELQLDNVPPFEEEPFAPPPATLKPRLQFWYTSGTTEVSAFWTKLAHEWADVIEPFIGDSREVREAATAALVGATTPDEKLRKLYARVQQIRNLSFEPEKTNDETRKLGENRSAQDVLRNGYGTLRDINRLFVAMARAAGLDAHVIRIGERDEQFLAKNLPIGSQLDGEIAVVTAEGKPYYLDPATPYAPFGTLSWQKAHTWGLLIARKQPEAVWVDTPRQPAEGAATRRVAALLLDNGVVRGTVVITYRGQEALRHRFALRNDDEGAARTSLEKGVEALFPDGAVVKVTDVSNLRAAEASLVVSATVELPSSASLVGSRAMVPLAIFSATHKNPFPSEQRKAGIYFHYAYSVEDDITLKVPAGYDVESLPAPSDIDLGALRYAITYQKNNEGLIRLNRKIVVESETISLDKYPLVRSFFSKAETADQEQVVLRKQATQARSTP
jgi:hypothetical protein